MCILTVSMCHAFVCVLLTFTGKAVRRDPRQAIFTDVAKGGPCMGAGVPVVHPWEMFHIKLCRLAKERLKQVGSALHRHNDNKIYSVVTTVGFITNYCDHCILLLLLLLPVILHFTQLNIMKKRINWKMYHMSTWRHKSTHFSLCSFIPHV